MNNKCILLSLKEIIHRKIENHSMEDQNRKRKKAECVPPYSLSREMRSEQFSLAFISQYSKCIWVAKSLPVSIRFFFIN